MLRIWGRLSSVNVQKVVVCANELGIAYERIDAGGKFGVVNTSEYRRLNPNGLVPVIEDGGFVLWESNAIVRGASRPPSQARVSLVTFFGETKKVTARRAGVNENNSGKSRAASQARLSLPTFFGKTKKVGPRRAGALKNNSGKTSAALQARNAALPPPVHSHTQ